MRLQRDLIHHAYLILGLTFVFIGYIVLFPETKVNTRLNLSDYSIFNLMIFGYILMLIYHFYILKYIYELTQMGLETLFQIISALIVVFSMLLYVPIFILFYNLDSTSQIFDLTSSWRILLILFIMQAFILIFNMIYIIKKRQII